MTTATRDRLQATLLASTEPAQTVKLAVVADQRRLETELLRARAALKLLADADVGVSNEWRRFAKDSWEATR